jgi:hypothetical protein
MFKHHALYCVTALGLSLISAAALAGEGGTSHVMPGAMSTLADMPPTAPTTFVKVMYLDYDAGASIKVPTAAGITTNLDVGANTIALALGHTFEKTVFGGAHYTMVLALPQSKIDISGDAALPGGGTRSISNSVNGLGDITIIPAMQLRAGPPRQHRVELLVRRPDRRIRVFHQEGLQCPVAHGLRDERKKRRH